MRVWLIVLLIAFNLYAFFDCARTEQDQIKTGKKWVWLLVIFIFEPIGAGAWFFFGRPKGNRGPGRNKRKIIPPDDDPDFLRKI